MDDRASQEEHHIHTHTHTHTGGAKVVCQLDHKRGFEPQFIFCCLHAISLAMETLNKLQFFFPNKVLAMLHK